MQRFASFGVGGDGALLFEPQSAEELSAIAAATPTARADVDRRRAREQLGERTLGVRVDVDPQDLAQARWAVVAPSGREREISELLKLLIRHRSEQAKRTFEVLTYNPGESAARFQARHRQGPGDVEPDRLPYYLLIAATPEELTFEVQQDLDIDHAVGRLDPSNPADLVAYTEHVIASERAASGSRRMAFLATKHLGDKATTEGADHLVTPLAAELAAARPTWSSSLEIGPTREVLKAHLGGGTTADLSLVCSHGLAIDRASAEQPLQQGALVAQEWPGPRAGPHAPYDVCVNASDVGPNVAGKIFCLATCFGAGTPRVGAILATPESEPTVLAQRPFTSALARRLLALGALAVISHVDRMWTTSFLWPGVGETTTTFSGLLRAITAGQRVGAAMETFARRATSIGALRDRLVADMRAGADVPPNALAHAFTAYHDARGFIVLGDPAATLGSR